MMNAIQSFWITEKSAKNGGWVNKRFESIAWSLSFFLLKKNFGNVHLYCNSEGYKFLIDELGLAYDKICNVLDEKQDLANSVWTMTKIYVYSLQETPFVHVDGDAFWFELPGKEFLESDIFAQSLEMDDPAYREVLANFQKYDAYWPDYLSTNRTALAANVGIVGGARPQLFKELYKETLQFYKKNLSIIDAHKEDFELLYIFIEQCFLVGLMNQYGVKVKFLKKPVFRRNFHEILNFNQISPDSKTPGFIHLLSSNRYRMLYCNFAEFWLYRLWPEQLEKINRIYGSNDDRNTSNSLDAQNEKNLQGSTRQFGKSSDVLNHPFARTQKIFKINPYETNEGDVRNHPASEKLSDCIDFEKRRAEVLSQMHEHTNIDSMAAHFERHLSFCASNYPEIADFTFEVNPFKILKSKYNWLDNACYETQYYWYNLIIDSQKTGFQEFLLSETECRIMELFEGRLSIEGLYTAWNANYPLPSDERKTKAMLHEALKELLANDLVRIC